MLGTLGGSHRITSSTMRKASGAIKDQALGALTCGPFPCALTPYCMSRCGPRGELVPSAG